MIHGEGSRDPFNLSLVVMPLVRLMKDAQISWAQREEVAGAIQQCIKIHASLLEERNRVYSPNEAVRNE